MNNYLKCEICVESDHEGQFCRCEGRNIKIAKEMRAREESPWLTSQPERLNPEDHIEDKLAMIFDSPTPDNK